jgi:hypothetical protein
VRADAQPLVLPRAAEGPRRVAASSWLTRAANHGGGGLFPGTRRGWATGVTNMFAVPPDLPAHLRVVPQQWGRRIRPGPWISTEVERAVLFYLHAFLKGLTPCDPAPSL